MKLYSRPHGEGMPTNCFGVSGFEHQKQPKMGE